MYMKKIIFLITILTLTGAGCLNINKQVSNNQEKIINELSKKVESLSGQLSSSTEQIEEISARTPNKIIVEKPVYIEKETNNNNSNNLIPLIEKWKKSVARIVCSFDGLGSMSTFYGVNDVKQGGSGLLILLAAGNLKTGQIDEWNYDIATNAHVIHTPPQKNILTYNSGQTSGYRDLFASSCDVSFSNHNTIYRTEYVKNGKLITTAAGLPLIWEFQEYDDDPNGVDFALINIINPDEYIKQNAKSLKSCQNVKLGEKIIVLGYPGIGSMNDITVTEGIISGEEQEYYVTSAKIDSGNSGGAAISADRDCFIGTPTATVVGEAESLGRILKTEYLLKKEGLYN